MKRIKLFFKKYLSRSKSTKQKHRNISRIKEYMQENPVEWHPRTMILKNGKRDISDPGYNQDDNFKILNTDYEEIKKEIVLEGNKETKWLHSSEWEWEHATLYYNNLKKRL
jgi:AAA15 family ATPase/GTPase